jgi:hypothetical protein
MCLTLFAVASQFFYFSWKSLHLATWATPTFADSPSMSLEVGQLAAAIIQVKLCPYDEEEPAIWFRRIEAQFAAAGIKSQKKAHIRQCSCQPAKAQRSESTTPSFLSKLPL